MSDRRRRMLYAGGAPDFDLTTIASTYAWWRADKPSYRTVDGSNRVTRLMDYMGDSSKDWAQATSGSAPMFNPSKAATGKPALDFITAAQLYMQNTMTRAASDMSIWFMIDRPDSTAVQNLFSTQTGLLVVSSVSGTTGNTGYYDTSWKQASNLVTGTQAIGFQFSGTGATSGSVYRGLTSLGTFAYSTARAIGGTSGLGTYFDGSAQWFNGCLYEMIIFNSALTFAQRSTLLSWWGAKYGYDPSS